MVHDEEEAGHREHDSGAAKFDDTFFVQNTRTRRYGIGKGPGEERGPVGVDGVKNRIARDDLYPVALANESNPAIPSFLHDVKLPITQLHAKRRQLPRHGPVRIHSTQENDGTFYTATAGVDHRRVWVRLNALFSAAVFCLRNGPHFDGCDNGDWPIPRDPARNRRRGRGVEMRADRSKSRRWLGFAL